MQVIGLIVEFIGVLVLAWEWFAAQRQDAAERAITGQHARTEASMLQLQRVQQSNPAVERHFEMTRDAQRRMADLRVEETRRSYGGMRVRAVATAVVLFVAGFVAQLLGSWPGCCGLIGIVPAS